MQRLEPSQRHVEQNQDDPYGRSFERRNSPGRDVEFRQRIQPVRESSEAFSGRSKTDLTVLTDEGDRITISLVAQVRYATSFQSGQGRSSQTVASSTSSQLRVEVDGDLSETELRDLGTLLSALSAATSPTQSPAVPGSSSGVPDASAFNAGFAGLGSLAEFAYSYKQTVEAEILLRTRG